MMPALANLQPAQLWKHFDKLAAIPRGSTKEAAAREYVRSVAAKLGLESKQDPAGNLVVRKPARPGREAAPMTLLQGHLDMVCEKNEGTVHDFDADPIKVVRDGDWLKADGTTLGADNGVGVAAALAVMESTDIAHGPLEFAFTIDEETGLTGAPEFPAGVLKSKYFLNLDTEEIGTLCIGCAGGVNTTARRKVKLVPAGAGFGLADQSYWPEGRPLRCRYPSGPRQCPADHGRRASGVARSAFPSELAEVNGGSAHNAIPREAVAVVVLDPSRESELKSLVAAAEARYKAELGGFDSGLQITAGKAERPRMVLDAADAKNTAALLASMPHGILGDEPRCSRPGPDVHEPSDGQDQWRRRRNCHQPAQRDCQQQTGGRPHGGDGLPAGGVRSGARRQLPRLET